MENIVQIQLIDSNNQLMGTLDVTEGSVFPLTYSITEIRDISKKKGTTSKSITLKGNKNNNILLNNYYDVNIEAGTFDINAIQACNVIQNGITILGNAVMQLVSVNKSQLNNNYEDQITYTVNIKDKTSDFFTTINNKYLTDLVGFDWMNHRYTADNVIASFNNTVVDGYKYVMPYNPSAPNPEDTLFNLTEFAPAIYAKTYFDKIFSNAGFSYYWPDMDNDDIQFSKLIIPWNGDIPKFNTEEADEFNVDVYRTGTTTSLSNFGTESIPFNGSGSKIIGSTPFLVTFPFENSDPANLFNTSTSTYTTPQIPSTTNNLEYYYEVVYEVAIVNPGSTAYLKNYSTLNGTSSSFSTSVVPKIQIKKNNIYIYGNDSIATTPINVAVGSIPNGTTIVGSGFTTVQKLVPGLDPNTSMTANAYIDINPNNSFRFSMFKNSASATFQGNDRTDVKFQLKIKSMRLKYKAFVNGNYGYNAPVTMSKYIPEKVKQSDFIKSIFTMFNLFAEVNRENPNRIDIKSRNAYYDDGKFNDWTTKLCKEKDQELKFLPEIANKKLLMTYKEDKDLPNTIYKEATGEVYGQQEFIFDNEYVRDITKQEIIFSPTPMYNTSFGAISPMWLGGAPKCNIRILIDGGEYPTTATYTIYDYWFDGGSQKIVTNNTYPHISHWNKPINPTFDINFGVCDYYFRSDNYGANTNNNLFNLHWRRTLNQINSGKLLTAYFNLSESDIYTMRLSDKIRIDNSWWNINKIQDYDANSTNPTKVELISIDDNLYMPFETRVVNKLDVWDNSLVIPRIANSAERDKFLSIILTNNDVTVKGPFNYVGPDVTQATIQGSNNFVTENTNVLGNNNIIDSPNSFIMGDNNTANTESNVVIFGNNITADTANTVYITNLVIPSGGTFTVSGMTGGGTLQTVSDAGATTSNSLVLNGGFDSIISSGLGTTQIFASDPDFLLLGHGLGNPPYVDRPATITCMGGASAATGTGIGITAHETGVTILGATAWLRTDTLSTDRNIQFPDNSGTLALLSDITGGTGSDTFVTGGTYTAGTTTFTNNTGGTFTVTGYLTGGTSQLELLNEGSGNGWRLLGKNPANYGPIGPNAVDFSHSTIPSATMGATGAASFAEGANTTASGQGSHAEGGRTVGIGVYSTASGLYSHVEGCDSVASGIISHAEGVLTQAIGDYSHSEGSETIALGLASHAGGYNTIASTQSETVIGQYSSNITGSATTFVTTDPIFRVGIGTNSSTLIDGFRVYKNGAMYMNPTTGSSITNGANGFFFYNNVTKKLASHDGTSFKDYAHISTTAPASSGATGTVGEIRITSTFIYTCIATNTWVRGAMASW